MRQKDLTRAAVQIQLRDDLEHAERKAAAESNRISMNLRMLESARDVGGDLKTVRAALGGMPSLALDVIERIVAQLREVNLEVAWQRTLLKTTERLLAWGSLLEKAWKAVRMGTPLGLLLNGLDMGMKLALKKLNSTVEVLQESMEQFWALAGVFRQEAQRARVDLNRMAGNLIR